MIAIFPAAGEAADLAISAVAWLRTCWIFFRCVPLLTVLLVVYILEDLKGH